MDTNDANTSKRSENLQEMINHAQPLLEQMNQIVFFKNIDFTYAYCNKNLVNFSRLNSKKRIIGAVDYDLPWAEDANFYRKIDKAILGGEEKKIIMEVRVASGEKISALQNKKAIYDTQHKQVVGILATMTELSNININKFLSLVRKKDKNIITASNLVPAQYYFEKYQQYSLSNRESECLFYLLRGMTTKMIANILKISPRTAEKFIINIKMKLGCRYKSELVEKAIKDGMMNIIPPSINFNHLMQNNHDEWREIDKHG